MSIRRPAPRMEGADYSYFDRFHAGAKHGADGEEQGIDLKLLLEDLRFSSATIPGLELVDILVNATRRALIGNLGEAGWCDIARLMVHRKTPYINFMILREGGDAIHNPPYLHIVKNFFSSGGRSMVAPRFLRSLGK